MEFPGGLSNGDDIPSQSKVYAFIKTFEYAILTKIGLSLSKTKQLLTGR